MVCRTIVMPVGAVGVGSRVCCGRVVTHYLVSNMFEVSDSGCTVVHHSSTCARRFEFSAACSTSNKVHAEIYTYIKRGNSNCNMPKPYSENLRWRAVWLNVVCGMSSF